MKTIEEITAGHNLCDSRKDSIRMAIESGADEATIIEIRDANRASRKTVVTLLPHRYENLSRGNGWCRKGRGDSAEWANKNEKGNYVVGPGTWAVGGHDGFTRKNENVWTVKHIAVGTETWTIANPQ